MVKHTYATFSSAPNVTSCSIVGDVHSTMSLMDEDIFSTYTFSKAIKVKAIQLAS
jgi:hypothetical protein